MHSVVLGILLQPADTTKLLAKPFHAVFVLLENKAELQKITKKQVIDCLQLWNPILSTESYGTKRILSIIERRFSMNIRYGGGQFCSDENKTQRN
jgi:hypothetical protein